LYSTFKRVSVKVLVIIVLELGVGGSMKVLWPLWMCYSNASAM